MSDGPTERVTATRRDVVRAGGVIGGGSLLGVTGTTSADTTTRVVEVGCEFDVDVPADTRLATLHVDGAPPYRVATDSGRLVTDPYGPLTDVDRSLLDDAAFVVRDATCPGSPGDCLSTALSARDAAVERLPRRLEPDYRAAYAVRVATPLDVSVPSVTRAGDAASVGLAGTTHRVPPGETVTFELSTRTATVETRTVREGTQSVETSDPPADPAALADVPPDVETGTVALRTAVTPVVRLRNLGPLTVEHGHR